MRKDIRKRIEKTSAFVPVDIGMKVEVFAFLIKEPVLEYKQIENSLLQTIVHLVKEGRILMRKTKEMMEMHILELPKLPPEQQNENDLMQWMRFLGGKNRELTI